MLNKQIRERKIKKYNTFVYYVVQCTASILFLVISYTMPQEDRIKTTCVIVIIIMKIGTWPFNMWYLRVISSLKMENSCIVVLMTIQKIIPLWVIASNCQNSQILVIVICMVNILSSSTIVSGISSFKSLIALRSMFNNSWLILSLQDMTLSISFLLLYGLRVVIVIKIMGKKIKNNSHNRVDNTSTLVICANIVGVPPIFIFTAKVIIIKSMINTIIITLGVATLAINCVFSYFYIRHIRNILVSRTKKEKVFNKKKENLIVYLIIIVSTTMIVTL